jgi:hypothetical protein
MGNHDLFAKDLACGGKQAKPRKRRRNSLASVMKEISKAGVTARYEVDPDTGKIGIVPTASNEAVETTNDLDKWIAKHAH